MRQSIDRKVGPSGTPSQSFAGNVVVVGGCVVGTVLLDVDVEVDDDELDDDELEDVELDEVELVDVDVEVVVGSVVEVVVVVGTVVLVDVVVGVTQLLYCRWSTSMPPAVLESLMAEMPVAFSAPKNRSSAVVPLLLPSAMAGATTVPREMPFWSNASNVTGAPGLRRSRRHPPSSGGREGRQDRR